MKHPKRMTDDELEQALIDVLDEFYLRETQFISISADAGAKQIVCPDFTYNYKVSPGSITMIPPSLPDTKTEIQKSVDKLNKSFQSKIEKATLDHEIGFQKLVASLCLGVGLIIIAGAIWPG
jgi:hypothetical protein